MADDAYTPSPLQTYRITTELVGMREDVVTGVSMEDAIRTVELRCASYGDDVTVRIVRCEWHREDQERKDADEPEQD